MSHLEEYLRYYNSVKMPGYAVLVTGDWGCGKTYQVKKCIPDNECFYVSLFGVQTVEQLHSEVFAAANPTMAKVESVLNSGTKPVSEMGGAWSLVGAVPGVFGAIFKKQLESDKTLIFDDLERCGIKCQKDVLGAINTYVEHLGFRVIIIAHDEEIENRFKKTKEKIVGQSIRAIPQVEQALDHFISEIECSLAKKFVDGQKGLVRDNFLRSGVKSLRILRQITESLTRLYSALDEKYLEHSEAMEGVSSLLIALQLEVLSGNLSREDLSNRIGVRHNLLLSSYGTEDPPSEQPPLIKADEKYPTVDLESNLLSDEVLCAMLFDGRYPEKEIQECLDNSSFFLVPEQSPPWKVVIQFDELDDEVVDEALDRMNEQFQNRSVTNSGEMLHIFCLRMMMAENKIIDNELAHVVAENKAYIDDILEDGSLPPAGVDYGWTQEFEHGHESLAYWVSDTRKQDFKEIWDYLITAREKALRRTFPKILETLKDKMRENSRGFFEDVSTTNNGPNPYARVPLLHEISVGEFVDHWLSCPRENWRDIEYALNNRYRGTALNNELEPEREWALALLSELERQASKESGFCTLRIMRMRPKALLEVRRSLETVSE